MVFASKMIVSIALNGEAASSGGILTYDPATDLFTSNVGGGLYLSNAPDVEVLKSTPLFAIFPPLIL